MTDDKSAWGYVRLSQQGRDTSLDEQKRSIRTYASDRGLDLLTTRNEGEGTSGFDPDRDEYQLLREKIRGGDIDAVVTRDRSRLSRDFDDRLALITEFRASGVEWHVVEAGGRLHLEDVQRAGFECLHAMMDHYKKMVEIERSREATQERVDKGYYQGKPPFGLQFDDDGQYLIPDHDDDAFDRACEALDLVDGGDSIYSAAQAIDSRYSVVEKIVGKNREMYEKHR